MDNIDATDRSIRASKAAPPSLLTLILDTNPLAWHQLSPNLPLRTALQSILIFLNAHLAINHANQVAVLASHVGHVEWLYPVQEHRDKEKAHQNGHSRNGDSAPQSTKYRPFAAIEEQLVTRLQQLITSTPASIDSLTSPPLLSGAISIALTHANMQRMISCPVINDPSAVAGGIPGAADLDSHTSALRSAAASDQLVSRILVISVSNADLSGQYIGLMNSVFAAQRMRMPIDVLRIGTKTAFLQQASDATGGIFITYEPPAPVTSNGTTQNGTTMYSAAAAGLLQTLMMAYLPDTTARMSLVTPGSAEVDFRSACFCHGKVVDLGGVCSVCLSIFCLPLPTTTCPTCQSTLKIPKTMTVKPSVVPKGKKKKKKKQGDADSAAGTPAPGGTPRPV